LTHENPINIDYNVRKLVVLVSRPQQRA